MYGIWSVVFACFFFKTCPLDWCVAAPVEVTFCIQTYVLCQKTISAIGAFGFRVRTCASWRTKHRRVGNTAATTQKGRILNCFVVRGHRLQDFWVILGKLNRWLNILRVPTSITDMWIRGSWYLQIPCNIWLLPWFHIFHGIEITMMHEPFTRCVCKGESHMCFWLQSSTCFHVA